MRSIIIGFICLINISAAAQNRDLKFKSYFDTLSVRHLYDGNIVVAEKGRKLYSFSAGYANYTTQQLNTSLSRFNLASISKIFTSTAILQLKDRGKLKLDDKVSRYLPTFPFPDITLRHLLTHTSGLPNLELFDDVVKQNPDTVITNAIVLHSLKQWKKGLYFKPGEAYSYCNTNFNLLALIVEKVSGLDFSVYMERYIFKPAGMNNTYIADNSSHADDSLKVKQQIKPTFYDTSWLQADKVARYRYSEYNNSGCIGSSNVITTVDDMLKFDDAFFSGKLLQPASVEEAITPVKLNNGKTYEEHMDTMQGEGIGQYGLGWKIFNIPGYGKAVGHGGFKFGLATFYCHHLGSRQVIIAYTNGNSSFGDNITSCFYMLNNKPGIPIFLKKSVVREYAKALMSQGADHAACVLHHYRADSSYYFDANEMNYLGYDFLYQSKDGQHKQWALETFKLYTFLQPSNFNTYDSYGEALLDAGFLEDAIMMYRKSLELNPTSEDGIKAMKKLGLM